MPDRTSLLLEILSLERREHLSPEAALRQVLAAHNLTHIPDRTSAAPGTKRSPPPAPTSTPAPTRPSS